MQGIDEGNNQTKNTLCKATMRAMCGKPEIRRIRMTCPAKSGARQLTVYKGVGWADSGVQEHVDAVRAPCIRRS